MEIGWLLKQKNIEQKIKGYLKIAFKKFIYYTLYSFIFLYAYTADTPAIAIITNDE